MKNYFKNRTTLDWVIGGVVAVALVAVGVSVFGADGNEASETDATSTAKTVSVIDLQDVESVGATVRASGKITSNLDAEISPQSSGVVSRVAVDVGESVSQGQILIALENSAQAASVSQARASVDAAQARLEEMREGATDEDISIARSNVESAEIQLAQARESLENAQDSSGTSVESAEENLLNTGLAAYLSDASEESGGPNENFTSPTISGTYDSTERGEYRIDLFASGAPSGYSFRYSGLEEGTATVSTAGSVPFGDRGLEIQFPQNFATGRNIEWVIPIPNKNAPGFVQAKNALEQARDGEDSSLDQARRAVESAEVALDQQQAQLQQTLNGTRDEQLRAQEAQVAQARAGLQSAESALSKTTIRAPFSGSVTTISPKVGEYLSPGSPVVSLVNKTDKKINVSLASGDASKIAVGNSVEIEGVDATGEVLRVGDGVNSQTGKVEAVISLAEDFGSDELIGEFVTVEIAVNASEANSDGGGAQVTIPLEALRATGDGALVYEITEDSTLKERKVTTGDIVGESIEIVSGIENIDRIAASVRGLSDGMNVTIR